MSEQIEARAAQFATMYGDDGGPTVAQWRRMLSGPAGTPVTVINFFKLRAVVGESTGLAEMMSYASVSGPTLEKVGGRFTLSGPFQGTFMGDDEDWDLVAIASYPSRDALVALLEDAAYREAWPHRVAAVERQRVMLAMG